MPSQNDVEAAAQAFSAQFDGFVDWLRARGVDLDDRPGSVFRKTLLAQRTLEGALDMAAITRAVEGFRAA
jgi:hypothetical protein